LAKEKGNAAFKAADYPSAVGHYTDAILADSSDHTFFLNRAAAYLKLGKSEDAERDCIKVLQLNPNNVKALFRRSQARRELENLDDAQADLDKALALEPTNESVKNEILDLGKLLQQRKLKQGPKYTHTVPKRRRVPIEIVEADAAPSCETAKAPRGKDTDLLQPVSSRLLRQEGGSLTTAAPASKPQTFEDAKQARKEFKPARVSGGIFRPAGNHTIVSRTQSEGVSLTRESTPQPALRTDPEKPPTTLFQFTKIWESLESDGDKWNLIRTIPPSSIPALFQVSLEPELLKSILHMFEAVLEQDMAPDRREVVRSYLTAFTKVRRFGMVMMFMGRKERQLLEKLTQ